MSWRRGIDIFLDVIRTIDKHDMDEDHRLDLKAELLTVFLHNDIDPVSLDDVQEITPIYDRFLAMKATFQREY